MKEQDKEALLYLLTSAPRVPKEIPVADFAKSVAMQPEIDLNLLCHVTHCLVENGLSDDALDALDRSRARFEGHPKIDSAYGEIFASRKDWKSALPYLERAFLAEPKGHMEAIRYVRAQFKALQPLNAIRTMFRFART